MQAEDARRGPLIVADRSRLAHTLAIAELDAAGSRVTTAADLPPRTWNLRPLRIVCACTVEDASDVEEALVLAARGAGIVALSLLAKRELARFVDDLRRFGRVDVRSSPHGSEPAALDAEQSLALGIVAAGGTLPDVAAALHCSPRTAGRRLAAARTALGVRTTAEAIGKLRG